jgi:hypothetical protein
MKTAAIRDKLNDYIRIADDEKIKAMYVLFKNEINAELAWWQNNDFIKELDADYKKWKAGKANGYSVDEVKASINQLRQKRHAK